MTNQENKRSECRWQRRLPHLSALNSGDPERREWEAHAMDCSECGTHLFADRELIPRLRSLPDRGDAYVTGAVMRRIRGARPRLLGRREATWGLAGSVAGAALGLWLASALPNGTSTGAMATTISGYAEVSDEVDLLIASFAADQSGGGS